MIKLLWDSTFKYICVERYFIWKDFLGDVKLYYDKLTQLLRKVLLSVLKFRSSRLEVFYKKVVLKNFAKSTGK